MRFDGTLSEIAAGGVQKEIALLFTSSLAAAGCLKARCSGCMVQTEPQSPPEAVCTSCLPAAPGLGQAAVKGRAASITG